MFIEEVENMKIKTKCCVCGKEMKEDYIALFINHMVLNEIDCDDGLHDYIRLGFQFRCN